MNYEEILHLTEEVVELATSRLSDLVLHQYGIRNGPNSANSFPTR
jgi:hypothetical protein